MKIVSFLVVLLFSAAAPFAAFAGAFVQVQEVTSPGGIKAWLVRDDKLPLVAMRFAFRGGVEQDPEDKQGLAELTMALLDQGAGPYDAEAFQQRLADRSISLKFSAERDVLKGSLKTLREGRDEAFRLLRLALVEPRFVPEAFARAKKQQLTAMKLEMGSAGWQARRALFAEIFKGHPYAMRHYGTLKTLQGLMREDVKIFAARHFARDNLVVSAVGDISPEELGASLDAVFGALPEHAELALVGDAAWPGKVGTILVKREGTQTDMFFASPMLRRDDPDWYAAEIVNYVLGGGGFSSRLMDEVRDKKGLTYGIRTGLVSMDHASLLAGQASTDNPKTRQAREAVLHVWQGLYACGVTDEEIAAAKDYLSGALPIALTSTQTIAGMLLEMRLEHLGRDYLDRYEALIQNVSRQDVERVIRKWFNPDNLALVMVGAPEGVSPTQIQEQTRE